MSGRTRNKGNGLKSNPHFYDGEDVLNKVMMDAIGTGYLSPGVYPARAVGNVKMSTDPDSKVPYRVLAYIPELDRSIGEPHIYSLPSNEEVQSFSFFEPLPKNLQPPGPGEHILIQIIDPNERVGYYIGRSESDYEMKNIKGTTASSTIKEVQQSKASGAFDKTSQGNAVMTDYTPAEDNQIRKNINSIEAEQED